MSALPTSLIHAMPSHHDARNFIDVPTAAKLLGVTERSIQLQCRANKLVYLNVANPNGGKGVFLIDRRSNPQLSPGAAEKKSADEAFARIGADQRLQALAFTQLQADARAYIAEARSKGSCALEKTILEGFLNFRRMTDPSVPSLRTYYRKSQALRQSGGSLAAIADRRKVPGLGSSSAEFSADAQRWFWTTWADSHLNFRTVYEMLKAHVRDVGLPWQVPSERTVQRWFNEIPKADRVEARMGPDAREDGFDPFILRNYDKMCSDDQWQSDHHQLDITAIDDLPGGDFTAKRLWLTTWLDVASRYVVAWRLSRGPNSQVVMASFCDGVDNSGGYPRGIYIDNGKDYRCKAFAGGRRPSDPLDEPGPAQTHVRSICQQLHITVRFALPYGARAKLIEPWHGHWICEKFSKSFPSYVGNNSLAKPEKINDLVAAGDLPRWSEIQPLVAMIIEAFNVHPHTGNGMNGQSPVNMYAAKAKYPKQVCASSTLHLFLQGAQELTVGRNGVAVNGYYYGGDSPDLMRLQGDRVIVRSDINRADVVYIYDLQDCYLCDAFNFLLCDANATREEAKAVNILRHRAVKMRKALAPIEKIVDAPGPRRIIELQLLAARNKAAQLPPPVVSRNIVAHTVPAPGPSLPSSPPTLRLTSSQDSSPKPQTSVITTIDLDKAAASDPQHHPVNSRRREPPASPPATDHGSDPWSVFE